MTKNMGTADRIIRAVLGVVFGILILGGVVRGVAAVILGIVAVAFLATAAVGFCPGYVPFGIDTCRRGAGGSGCCGR